MATATAGHANGAARQVTARTEAALRRRASQLQKLVGEVEELLGQVSRMDDPEVSRLRSRVEATIAELKSAAEDGMHTAIEHTRNAARATDEYVHNKPWIAMGATAVAGIALGALAATVRR